MPFSWLLFGTVKASATARAEALACQKIEDLMDSEGAATVITGGRQTKGALPVSTDLFDAALYSSRGRGYARYNEDGAQIFRDERGHLYAAVFDQAGGLGGTVRGAASAIAAKAAFTAFRKVATADKNNVDIEKTLVDGIFDAHRTLVARNEGEVTTAVVMVAEPGRAVIVNSGDSAAIMFDKNGEGKTHTDKHEVTSPMGIGCITHAIGLEPEEPAPDAYEWKLDPGDWIIMCSDGLLDAGLAVEQIGTILKNADSAEDAVNDLASKVLKRMTLMQAKPDNLTILAVRRRG